MGTRYTYKCDECSYSVDTSGETSIGMYYVVSPYKCNDCNIVTDVIVGMFGQIYFEEQFEDSKIHELPEFIRAEKNKYYNCEECNGKNITDWDSVKSSCPKCNGVLNVDPTKPIVNWD